MKELRNAFTLIELLVVISIIAILIALLFPVFGIAEEKANRSKCQSNLHQIAVATAQQFGELGDKLPYRGPQDADQWNSGAAANQLMPYVKNIKEVFDCPANPGFVDARYVMGTNANGIVNYTEYQFNSYLCSYGSLAVTINKRQNGITDFSVAAYAYDYPYKLYVAGVRSREQSSPHGDGMNVAYLDGHAGWLPCKDHGLNYSAEPPTEIGNTAFFRRGSIWGL